jgi:GNAT superfamily N-acetyltransferase
MSTAVSFSSSLTVRPAIPSDVPTLFNLIVALAEYEKLAHEVIGSVEALHQHLFGEQACIEAAVAVWDGETAGFALFFVGYSTSITQPQLYLEDLFVLPSYRGKGIGKALLSYLARLALERNYGRLEWSVLDWNTPAIRFYQQIGAQILEDVRICRVSGDALPQLAAKSSFIRAALPNDVAAIFALVKANVEHDGSLHLFRGKEEELGKYLFEQSYLEHPYIEAVIAEQNSQAVGVAVFYITYSTFLTKPGLFVEDLFVLPEYRSQGIGKALLADLSRQVIERGYGRLEWRVRTWNDRATQFYQRIGATVLPDWRVCQLYRQAAERLAL